MSVWSETDLAMKEERAMSQRLRAQRRFTHIIVVVVAVLGIVAFVSLPLGMAGDGKSIAQRVRDAKTPGRPSGHHRGHAPTP
jgi:hypothetical protein